MKGLYKVVLYTKRLRYEFELRRNITIVRGDSATGKTTLVDMVEEHMNNPSGSSVEVNCEKPCYTVSGITWKEQLTALKDSIIFIDEGNDFVGTDDFARAIRESDNYYVIVTREGLPSLPYSIEEIYGIRTAGKYGNLKQQYNEFYKIYGTNVLDKNVKPDIVITEDSNAGYEFFLSVCKEKGIHCITANGKSNIFHALKTHHTKSVLAIADGAAFGSEIDRILKLLKDKDNMAIYLPESFEWLILLSDIIKSKEVKKILEDPGSYIESKDFFSWERYFTNLLVRKTEGTFFAYSKNHLNKAYTNPIIQSAILKIMEKK